MNPIVHCTSLVVLALLASPPSMAQAPTVTTTSQVQPPPKLAPELFAEDSGISGMRLSPDGKLIALRSTIDGKVSLTVLAAEGRTGVSRLSIPEKNELEWYRWAGSSKLLVSLSREGAYFGEEVRYTRLFLFDLTTKAFTPVGSKSIGGVVGDDVVHLDPDGQFLLLSAQRDPYSYPSVWRFPLDGNAAKSGKVILNERDGVWDWYADTAGVVRMGFELLGGGKFKVLYRSKADEPFRAIAKLNENSKDEDLFDVIRIVGESDEGYVLKANDAGNTVLRRFNYATRTPGETVFEAPGWDVSDASIGDDNKVIAAFYTDERDKVAWFDPKMKAMQARLDRALKGSDVWITSRSKDDTRMIVWAGHEEDPGAYYLYTASSPPKLEMILAEKQKLMPAQMAKPQPISFKARDGVQIRGYLTLPLGRAPKGLPLIILPHGGPYGVRDKLEFNPEVQFLANRGYVVLQPNYRGSDGFGQGFTDLGKGQIGRAMQDDIDDAMDWAVREGYADAKRVCVVGSSYGGYAALWAVIRNPERYRCAASFAGVTDFKRQLKYDGKFFSSKGARSWTARVRGDDTAFDLDTVSPALQVARLTRPVLLTHGDQDTNVPFRQFTQMRDAAAKAKVPIETLVFPGEGHGFDKPEDEALWYKTLEDFLARNNPAG